VLLAPARRAGTGSRYVRQRLGHAGMRLDLTNLAGIGMIPRPSLSTSITVVLRVAAAPPAHPGYAGYPCGLDRTDAAARTAFRYASPTITPSALVDGPRCPVRPL